MAETMIAGMVRMAEIINTKQIALVNGIWIATGRLAEPTTNRSIILSSGIMPINRGMAIVMEITIPVLLKNARMDDANPRRSTGTAAIDISKPAQAGARMGRMSMNTISTHVTLMNDLLSLTIMVGSAMISVLALRIPIMVPSDATARSVHFWLSPESPGSKENSPTQNSPEQDTPVLYMCLK